MRRTKTKTATVVGAVVGVVLLLGMVTIRRFKGTIDANIHQHRGGGGDVVVAAVSAAAAAVVAANHRAIPQQQQPLQAANDRGGGLPLPAHPPPPPPPHMPTPAQALFPSPTSLPPLTAEAHIFYYPWYGTPAVDGKWWHWNHERLPHWKQEIAKKFSRAVYVLIP
jgi:hypothetical protein